MPRQEIERNLFHVLELVDFQPVATHLGELTLGICTPCDVELSVVQAAPDRTCDFDRREERSENFGIVPHQLAHAIRLRPTNEQGVDGRRLPEPHQSPLWRSSSSCWSTLAFASGS